MATHGFETALAYGLSAADVAAYRAAYPGDLLAAIETDWSWRLPALSNAVRARCRPGPRTGDRATEAKPDGFVLRCPGHKAMSDVCSMAYQGP